MSPRRIRIANSEREAAEIRRVGVAFGLQVRSARIARGWSVRELANAIDCAPDTVYAIESGQVASAGLQARLAVALRRRLEIELVDPRKRASRPSLAADPVHSAMGEFEARRLRGHTFNVGVDEPYQHYQFAGRADVIAWDIATRAFLHIENRTRFPDFQEMAGAFNAKKAYLGPAVAARVGITNWASETHVIAALWSSEVLHALRLRTDSFRALCSDPADSFAQWWAGQPAQRGRHATLIVLDPLAAGRRREWVNLDDALTTRPRHHGYADVAHQLAA